MPVIIAGQSGAQWGLNSQSGIIAQEGEWEASVEENPGENSDGEVQMTSFFNPTATWELAGIFIGIHATLGAIFAITALILPQAVTDVPNGNLYLRNVGMTQRNDGFAGIRMRGIQYNLF